jgi:hypothetical protein
MRQSSSHALFLTFSGFSCFVAPFLCSLHTLPPLQAVATFLKAILANETAYAEYHAWRNKPLPDSFLSAATTSKQHWPCGACRKARGHGKPGNKVRPKIVTPERIEYINASP